MVILIGDANPNPYHHILPKRLNNKKNIDWNTSIYPETYFYYEVEKLKEKNIPIYSYYLKEEAKKDFEFIAKPQAGIGVDFVVYFAQFERGRTFV